MTIFLIPPLSARRSEVLEVMKRLWPAGRHLDLEKVVLRTFLQEDRTQVPRDTTLSFADPSGHRLELTVAKPHAQPLQALDPLRQIQARRRGATYAYELVKTLAPPEPSADFPAGTFQELDLAEEPEGPLFRVDRPHEKNRAALVVGLISSFTAKHPEGMERVLLLGDATREMGALAEPECRRIIAALDLAEQRGLPVEWFAVSSGARIAMDSNTENLDWTAPVLPSPGSSGAVDGEGERGHPRRVT